jgi:hypothetical protein
MLGRSELLRSMTLNFSLDCETEACETKNLRNKSTSDTNLRPIVIKLWEANSLLKKDQAGTEYRTKIDQLLVTSAVSVVQPPVPRVC